MKSLRYLLGGKPCTLDDCLDLCIKEKPDLVTFEIGFENDFLDFDLFRRMIVRTTWKLPRCRFSCIKTVGGYLLSQSSHKKQIAIDRANARLQSYLEKIQKKGIKFLSSGLTSFPPTRDLENEV